MYQGRLTDFNITELAFAKVYRFRVQCANIIGYLQFFDDVNFVNSKGPPGHPQVAQRFSCTSSLSCTTATGGGWTRSGSKATPTGMRCRPNGTRSDGCPSASPDLTRTSSTNTVGNAALTNRSTPLLWRTADNFLKPANSDGDPEQKDSELKGVVVRAPSISRDVFHLFPRPLTGFGSVP